MIGRGRAHLTARPREIRSGGPQVPLERGGKCGRLCPFRKLYCLTFGQTLQKELLHKKGSFLNPEGRPSLIRGVERSWASEKTHLARRDTQEEGIPDEGGI